MEDNYILNGESPERARELASIESAELMNNLAALHNPDLISGGKDEIADFGNKRINSSIGSQWRSRVDKIDEAAKLFQRTSAHPRK